MGAQRMLSELSPGMKGRIGRVTGEGKLKTRLLQMGIIPGSLIQVLKLAPFGDPIDVSIKGYQLSLRKDEAQQIIVETEDA